MTPFHRPYSMRWNRSSLQYSSVKFRTTCCRGQCCTQELCTYKSWTRDSHNREVPHLSVSKWTTYWLSNSLLHWNLAANVSDSPSAKTFCHAGKHCCQIFQHTLMYMNIWLYVFQVVYSVKCQITGIKSNLTSLTDKTMLGFQWVSSMQWLNISE